MKYKLTYTKPKKKGFYSNQMATFYTIEDAVFFEGKLKEQGCLNFQITPV